MTIYHEVSRAVGPDAQKLRDEADRLRAHRSAAVSVGREIALEELRDAASDRQEANWDGYGAPPVLIDSYIIARKVIMALPSFVPNPAVDVDTDGEVSLEWHEAPRKTFSVSISKDGEMHYAGLFGYNKVYGTEYFADVIPKPILDVILSRFVIDRKKFSPENKTLKAKAFEPGWDPKHQAWVLSTFCIDGITEAEIWQLGRIHLRDNKGRTPKARGDLPSSMYEGQGFRLDRDDDPERHVSVHGWPTEKPARMSKAQDLAVVFDETRRAGVGRFSLSPEFEAEWRQRHQ